MPAAAHSFDPARRPDGGSASAAAPWAVLVRGARCVAGRPAPLAAAALVLLANPAGALAAAAAKATGDDAPLDLGGGESGGEQVGPGGGSVARVLVGLLVVVGVIYGVTWLLKQLKGGREQQSAGAGLTQVTTLPLQGGAALSLVRVGDELLLLGSGANGATTLRRWDEDEARELGLWPDDPSDDDGPATPGGGGGGSIVAILGRSVRTLQARTARRSEVVLASDVAPATDGLPTPLPASRAFVAPGTVLDDAPTPTAPAPSQVVLPPALRAAAGLLDRMRARTVRS